uniref:Uncharacterized protein n=1 Tax=Acrobeloides nanus TaxID=290746 RepID=A0A914C7B0_9BILA
MMSSEEVVIDDERFRKIIHQKLKAKHCAEENDYGKAVIYLNAANFDLSLGNIFYCKFILDGKVRAVIAHGKNSLEVRFGETGLTKFLINQLNTNEEEMIEVEQVYPIQGLESSFVFFRIVNAKVCISPETWIELNIKDSLLPSQIKSMTYKIWKGNLDGVMICGETFDVETTIEEQVDPNSAIERICIIKIQVEDIQTLSTSRRRHFEYCSTNTKMLCENILDSALLAHKRQQLEKLDIDIKQHWHFCKATSKPISSFKLCGYTFKDYVRDYDFQKEQLAKEEVLHRFLFNELIDAKNRQCHRPRVSPGPINHEIQAISENLEGTNRTSL